jgi:hypothetical protein
LHHIDFERLRIAVLRGFSDLQDVKMTLQATAEEVVANQLGDWIGQIAQHGSVERAIEIAPPPAQASHSAPSWVKSGVTARAHCSVVSLHCAAVLIRAAGLVALGVVCAPWECCANALGCASKQPALTMHARQRP